MFAQSHVNLAVGWPAELVASDAVRPANPGCNAVYWEIRARSACEYVKVIEPAVRVRCICRENPVDKTLVGRADAAFAVPLRRKIIANAVTIDVICQVTRPSEETATLLRCPWETAVGSQDTVNLPSAESFAQITLRELRERQIPQAIEHKLVLHIEVRRATI